MAGSLSWLILLLVIRLAVFISVWLALVIPIPWTDEAAFLAQAYALSHYGTLFVPALNPDRVLMWMPPGYMVFLAGVFKIFGYSFGAARWTSATLYVLTYAVLVRAMSQTLRGWRAVIGLLLVLAVATTPYVAVLANIARMEALYNFSIVISLYAVLRNRPALGFALVLATGTVHFNAVYFLPVYLFMMADATVTRRVPKMRLSDMAALVMAALVSGVYCVFAALHWRGLVADISWQFRLKAAIPFRATPEDVAFLAILAVMPFVQFARARALTRDVTLSLYGAGFFLLAFHGDERWYRFAFSEGLLLSAWSILMSWPQHGVGGRWLWAGLANGGLIAALVWGIGYYAYNVTPATAPYAELLAQPVVSKGEIKKISRQIRALPAGSTVSFGFGFNGMEPFFLDDLAKSHSTWIMHTHSATELDPQRSADYRVRCDSALFRSFLIPQADGDFPRFGVNSGCSMFRWHKTVYDEHHAG